MSLNPHSIPSSKRRRVRRAAPTAIVPPTGELVSTSLKAPLAPGEERREAVLAERGILRRGDAVEAIQRKEQREKRGARKAAKPKARKAPKPPRPTKQYKGAPKRSKNERVDPNSTEGIRARRERRLAKQAATQDRLS